MKTTFDFLPGEGYPTQEFCDIGFFLAEMAARKPLNVFQAMHRESVTGSCIAWINAYAITHGFPQLTVSENCLSQAMH